MRRIATVLLSFGLALPLLGRAEAPETTEATRAILVTGASTGIGRNITEHLAAKGYFVYAGARKQADLDALNAIKNVQAVKLDVTKQEDIDAAVETVTKAGRGLYGLVNNAGVATFGGITETSPEEFEFVMGVNVYGPYRMTRAFAPLIIASKGRITTIGSISGVLAPRDLAAYSMSKHAMEAFGDSLAMQMAPLGVSVSLIEPGNYNSDIGKTVLKRSGKESRFTDRSKYKQPDEVAAAAELALFEAAPKRRYMVTPDQNEAERTIKKQIEQLVQLNEGHPYTYDRDALVRMLDEAMATARPRSK
ncbi:MAG TPA: SDR family NAD(P)-dependent oxidoreductase [Steroidobacteraceae bacterium]|jgi:NAD(P)-dependent dehydrogenase (short-subunit alcohol dehydrogenase family)|nr:SDR family NAD(P)-dependent oxidoreductase [Steroidobacteraceae bacterium]